MKDCEGCLDMPCRLEARDDGSLYYWCSNCGHQEEIPKSIDGLEYINECDVHHALFGLEYILSLPSVQDALVKEMDSNDFSGEYEWKNLVQFATYMRKFNGNGRIYFPIEDLPEKKD